MAAPALPASAMRMKDEDEDEDDDDDEDAMRGGIGGSFYDQWPYSKPKDILPYIYANAKEGDARGVLAAMDEFGTYYPMWKLGPEKGGMLEGLVDKYKPARMLEIGTFLGYSAIHTALRLPPGGKLTCIEGNPEFAAVAKSMIKYAGQSGRVEVVVGRSDRMIPEVVSRLGTADIIFEDHAKDAYLPDLLQMMGLGLVRPGTVVVADNVLYSGGAPPPKGWLEYLVPENGWSTELLDAAFEYEATWKQGWEDEVERDALSVSVYNGPVEGGGAAVGGE